MFIYIKTAIDDFPSGDWRMNMSCYCKCPLALPHGAVGKNAVCDCRIS